MQRAPQSVRPLWPCAKASTPVRGGGGGGRGGGVDLKVGSKEASLAGAWHYRVVVVVVVVVVCRLPHVPANASVFQGWICLDNCTHCQTAIEVANQFFYLTQSQ